MDPVKSTLSTEATRPHSLDLVLTLETDSAASTAIQFWLRSEGVECLSYASVEQLAAACFRFDSFCILLEAQALAPAGEDLKEILAALDPTPPLVIYSAEFDSLTSLAIIESGGYSVLSGRVQPGQLTEGLQAAFENHRLRVERLRSRQGLLIDLLKLTDSEREVFDLLIRGQSTKSIAEARGVTPHTVQNQRAGILQKLGCTTQLELVARCAPLQFMSFVALFL